MLTVVRPGRRLLAISLIVLFWSLSCGGSETPAATPTSTATPTPTPEEGVELRVVNQNILHGVGNEDPEAEPFDRFPERIGLIASALAALEPDIIFLQEVVVPAAGSEYTDVRGVLLAALGAEYTAVFGDIVGGPINTGQLGQMTLTRLPIISTENHFVGGHRAVHHVVLQTASGTIDVYNAHLEGTEPDPQLAIDEIEDVLTFIRETRSGTGPVILAGDFNAEPEDPAIQAVLAAGFVDVLVAGGDATCERAGDPGCTNSTIPLGDNPENLADRRIDYIFVLAGEELSLDVGQAELFLNAPAPIGEGRLLWPSDHIGVQVLLEIK